MTRSQIIRPDKSVKFPTVLANKERLYAHHALKLRNGMRYIIAILGFFVVAMMLWDAFEVIILPRRVTRRLRFARFFYRFTWRLRSIVAELIALDRPRENYLSYFGPLSLLLLLTAWVTGLVAGFATMQWGLQDQLNVGARAAPFSTYLY